MIEKIIEFLKEKFPDGIQMFNCHGRYTNGHPSILVYEYGGVRVYHNWYYGYVDIIGVSLNELKRIDVAVNGIEGEATEID